MLGRFETSVLLLVVTATAFGTIQPAYRICAEMRNQTQRHACLRVVRNAQRIYSPQLLNYCGRLQLEENRVRFLTVTRDLTFPPGALQVCERDLADNSMDVLERCIQTAGETSPDLDFSAFEEAAAPPAQPGFEICTRIDSADLRQQCLTIVRRSTRRYSPEIVDACTLFPADGAKANVVTRTEDWRFPLGAAAACRPDAVANDVTGFLACLNIAGRRDPHLRIEVSQEEPYRSPFWDRVNAAATSASTNARRVCEDRGRLYLEGDRRCYERDDPCASPNGGTIRCFYCIQDYRCRLEERIYSEVR